MPKKSKLPTDTLWSLISAFQIALLIWEHGYQRGRDSSPEEDPSE
jgi:hypothetical protein